MKLQLFIHPLHLNYSEVIANPLEATEAINTFLSQELDLNAMAAAVDAKLYRNRMEVRKED